MRVLLAPDCFGGTLDAAEVAAALAEGWRSERPGDALDLCPLSDGGPGLLAALAPSMAGRLVPVEVEDPLGRPVLAAFLLDGRTAWVESAQAAGLHLLSAQERDPGVTSTRGVGQLVAAALEAGAERVAVGLGGSATNDGGAGALAALGLGPGAGLVRGGLALAGLDRLEGRPDLGAELVAATDVDAPLLGLHGASATYGPQKGADRAQVLALDAALTRWADLLEDHFGVAVRDLPGAGAAGGLGAALLALGGQRVSGLDVVAEAVGLDERVAVADLVVTGEGAFDFSSLTGKVVGGVARRAAAQAVPCVVVAGQVLAGHREAASAGVEETLALTDLVGLERSLAAPAEALRIAGTRLARRWSR